MKLHPAIEIGEEVLRGAPLVATVPPTEISLEIDPDISRLSNILKTNPDITRFSQTLNAVSNETSILRGELVFNGYAATLSIDQARARTGMASLLFNYYNVALDKFKRGSFSPDGRFAIHTLTEGIFREGVLDRLSSQVGLLQESEIADFQAAVDFLRRNKSDILTAVAKVPKPNLRSL